MSLVGILFYKLFVKRKGLNLVGGRDEGDLNLNTILEYDITSNSYTQIGTMTQKRSFHAISVVKYEDFSEWCQ